MTSAGSDGAGMSISAIQESRVTAHVPPPPTDEPGPQPHTPPPDAFGAQAAQPVDPLVAPAPQPVAQQANGLALAAMIVGIVSVVLVWVPLLGVLTLPSSMVAIGLGIAGIVRANKIGGVGKGQAITGIATGAATLVIGFVVFLVFVYLGSL